MKKVYKVFNHPFARIPAKYTDAKRVDLKI